MTELYCEYLSARYIWLYIIIISRTRFGVHLRSIVEEMSRNSLCAFTLKRLRDMIITYSQMSRADKCSQHGATVWPVWLNGWMFVYELCGCEFKSRCCHLNFRYHACFEQEVTWHSGNYRVWIHSEKRTWHDNNMQSLTLTLWSLSVK